MTLEWIFTVDAFVKMPTIICTRKAIPSGCLTDQIISPNMFTSNHQIIYQRHHPPLKKENQERLE